ncbi:hypothetical protein UPYG_G00141570 [Umbra pygmaea]|uniref:Fucolectin tachylectin-4 pentraxin-1 domain-containing protein n=1 Tax=Umbra pygmaea TaxID=75934 RepID=A0ABD0WZV8_UMBPY
MTRSTKMFLFLTLLGLTASEGTHGKINLALLGRATQSNTYLHIFADASHAIDGNKDANFDHGSCTHTKLEDQPWWRVEMQDAYRVDSVVLTNRGDCCPERLNGAEIHIGNSLENNGNNNPSCAVVSVIPAGESVSFNCNGMVGRFVSVVLPKTGVLTLCEVEVYGSK